MTPLRHKMFCDLTIRGRAESTKTDYIRIAKELAEYYHCSPDLLNAEQVQEFLFYLASEREYAPGSLNQAAFALRFLFHVTLGRPKAKFVIPTSKKPAKLPTVFSRSEIEDLFENANNLRNRALLMATYSNGLRISEVVNLKITDIDSSRWTIHIRGGKGDKDRMGGLAKRLHKTLQEYWRAYRPKIWLFPSRKYPHQHLSDNAARKMFHEVRKRAGIHKPCRFHDLRHSFATHLLEAGKDLRQIQKLMGHSSIMSTFIYIHLAQGCVLKTDSPLDLPPEPKR